MTVKEKVLNKVEWKPGTMVYPLPAVMVSCGTINAPNIITVAWTGTVCTEPAMTYVSIRPERYSYDIIKKTKEFAINLTTRRLVYAVDFCGVKSGRDINKFEALKLTPAPAGKIKAPIIVESPVNIECRVTEIKPLGSHHMFLARVLAIHADREYVGRSGAFRLNMAEPICYSHGKYYTLGREVGKFGFSVRKKKRK